MEGELYSKVDKEINCQHSLYLLSFLINSLTIPLSNNTNYIDDCYYNN